MGLFGMRGNSVDVGRIRRKRKLRALASSRSDYSVQKFVYSADAFKGFDGVQGI
jgi:hypothetical protein